MATTMLRNGVRTVSRLRINKFQPNRFVRTQTVFTQRQKGIEDFTGSGRTFQKAVHDKTPKSEYHYTPPEGARSKIVAVIIGVGMVGFYFAQKKNVKAKAAVSDAKELPIYKKADVAKHKTKESGIWE